MISIDFYLALSLYIIVLLLAFMAAWLLGRKHRDQRVFLESRVIWHCSVCTYTYVNTKDDSLSVCPRCGSYNKK